MENKNQNVAITVTAVVALLIGGLLGYFWLKYQTLTNELNEVKQQGVLEVKNETKKVDSEKGQKYEEGEVEEEDLPEDSSPGDVGENPPSHTVNWQVYEDAEHNFHFQYPDEYKIVVDNYGWPHAVVHLINTSGGQSYDVTFEVWDGQDDAENEGRGSDANSFFGNTESPYSGKYISMTCWNPDTAEVCDDIYSTFSFQ